MERRPRRQPERPDRFGLRPEPSDRPSRRRNRPAPRRRGRGTDRPAEPTVSPGPNSFLFLAFTLLAALSLINLNLWILTGRAAGERIQRRVVAELTEIERYVSTQFETIRATAEAGEEETVTLPEYPIPVTLSRAEAQSADPEALGETILDRAASRVYEDGLDAFAAGAPEGAGSRTLSPAGALELTAGNVTQSRNLPFLPATIGFGLLAAAAGARLIRPLPADEGIRALALGVILASVTVFTLAAAAWLLFYAAATGAGDTTQALLGIGRDAAMVSARNALAIVLVGIVGMVASRLMKAGPSPAEPEGQA